MSTTCSICLNEVKQTRHNTIRCGHIFHASCIERWKEQGKHTCPVCRKVFDVSQFKVTVTVENRFTARTSNTLNMNESQVFNIIDLIDLNFDADSEEDLESLLRDFGMSIADLDAAILDAESGTEV
mgnify:CR=1 FL=1|jgi:hypothetical protein